MVTFLLLSVCQVYELDGSVHDSRWMLESHINTTRQFVRDHPDFIGAKFILTALRLKNCFPCNYSTVCTK